MKFQVVYRDGNAEIHRASCRDISWDAGVQGAEVEAPNPYGAAVAAWSHKKTGNDQLVFDATRFFTCLTARTASPSVIVPAIGPRVPLEDKILVTATWAEEHGWDVKDLGQSLELTRGYEFLVCTWVQNRWDASASTWTMDGQSARLGALVDALRTIAGHPPAPNGLNGEPRRNPTKRPTQRNIPFDIDGDYDQEILGAVAGRTIVWVNSLDGEEKMAAIPAKPGPHTKIELSSAGRRILVFVDAMGTGFRSVALDTLVAVK